MPGKAPYEVGHSMAGSARERRYFHPTTRRRAPRIQALAKAAAAALAAIAVPAAADNIAWHGGTGDWLNSADWLDFSQIDKDGHYLNLVPGSADVVTIANAGNAQISGAGAAGNVHISGGSSLSILPGASLSSATDFIGDGGLGQATQSGGFYSASG